MSVDICVVGQLIKMEVARRLKNEFGHGLYRHDNVIISATHTHSGPGGYMQYLIYSAATLGFVEDSFQVIRL